MRALVYAAILCLATPGAAAHSVDLVHLTVHAEMTTSSSAVYVSDCSPPVLCQYVHEECDVLTTSGPHPGQIPPVGASVHIECIIG